MLSKQFQQLTFLWRMMDLPQTTQDVAWGLSQCTLSYWSAVQTSPTTARALVNLTMYSCYHAVGSCLQLVANNLFYTSVVYRWWTYTCLAIKILVQLSSPLLNQDSSPWSSPQSPSLILFLFAIVHFTEFTHFKEHVKHSDTTAPQESLCCDHKLD